MLGCGGQDTQQYRDRAELKGPLPISAPPLCRPVFYETLPSRLDTESQAQWGNLVACTLPSPTPGSQGPITGGGAGLNPLGGHLAAKRGENHSHLSIPMPNAHQEELGPQWQLPCYRRQSGDCMCIGPPCTHTPVRGCPGLGRTKALTLGTFNPYPCVRV